MKGRITSALLEKENIVTYMQKIMKEKASPFVPI